MRQAAFGVRPLRWSARAGTLLIATVVGAATAAEAPAAPGVLLPDAQLSGFTLKLPPQQPVVFRGMVSHDAAGVQGGQMLYPAPNVGGLLVAIFAHGVAVEAQKNSQRSQMQQAADQVLAPYKEALDAFTHDELARRGLAQAALFSPHRHVDEVHAADAGWVLESAPTFVLGQDQAVLVLENAVAIHRRGEPDKALFQGVVKVVSDPQETTAPADYWGAEGAARLRGESVRLFAHSLGVALAQARRTPGADGPQKTYRFPEGSSERMERGSMVTRYCNRLIIRNLRGWLLSIPQRPAGGADPAPCADPWRPA
jgi:hypothetical protein